jgi:hypothetical protein
MQTSTAASQVPTTNTVRAAEVDRAVMSYFIKHGKACSAKELSEHMERGEQWIRKVMNDNHGCTRGAKPKRSTKSSRVSDVVIVDPLHPEFRCCSFCATAHGIVASSRPSVCEGCRDRVREAKKWRRLADRLRRQALADG